MNTIKEFATSFPSLTLCCKFVALEENPHTQSFQNHYSKQTSTLLRVFFMRDQNVPLWEGLCQIFFFLKGLPLQAQKFESSFCWISLPTKKLSPLIPPLITDHICKKVSLIAFRQIFKLNPP